MDSKELFGIISRLPLGRKDKAKLYNYLTDATTNIESIIKMIGNIKDLDTETKSNIVAAINELNTKVNELNTEVDELNTEVDDIKDSIEDFEEVVAASLNDLEERKLDKIPVIIVSVSQVISSDPLTIQLTEEQDAIITSDAEFITIDVTLLGAGVVTFHKEESTTAGDYILVSPTVDYNSTTLVPETPNTFAVVYRHSTMIGVFKLLTGGISEDTMNLIYAGL